MTICAGTQTKPSSGVPEAAQVGIGTGLEFMIEQCPKLPATPG
jgi:hypothetical protein